MNWKKIDECWNSFAFENNLILDKSDHNLLLGLRTEYKLTLQKENYSLTCLSELKKVLKGIN